MICMMRTTKTTTVIGSAASPTSDAESLICVKGASKFGGWSRTAGLQGYGRGIRGRLSDGQFNRLFRAILNSPVVTDKPIPTFCYQPALGRSGQRLAILATNRISVLGRSVWGIRPAISLVELGHARG